MTSVYTSHLTRNKTAVARASKMVAFGIFFLPSKDPLDAPPVELLRPSPLELLGPVRKKFPAMGFPKPKVSAKALTLKLVLWVVALTTA